MAAIDMSPHEAKQLARELFLQTLPHLDVGAKLRDVVRLRDGALWVAGERIRLHAGRPLRVISIGKAASEMAATLAELLPGVPLTGVVAGVQVPERRLASFEYFACGHPLPNEQSWQAAEAALALLGQQQLGHDDVAIFLISGGGSAMLEKPLDPQATLGQLQEFYRALVGCGATIGEINTIRKHYSTVKGGRLAEAAWPARQITLYVSDVPAHLPAMVASGPTMPDETTLLDTRALFDRADLRVQLATFAGAHFRETPKPGDECFARSSWHCLLDNSTGVEALCQLAIAAGLTAITDLHCDDWNFQNAANHLLNRLGELLAENPGKPVAVISGGELSCPVTGTGLGGRNQAFVLDCAAKISGQRITVLSAGTDGIDGNSPATGAIADGEALARAAALGLDAADYQRRSDSFTFFDRLGDTIITGPTGTNVRDLRLLLAY